MRPLRLRMYGVGPYAREVDIDFARLNEDGLFLITGATGAGKTSIFDGITYALYGETNFKDDEKKNGIICDYLEDSEHRNTYVEFTFEVDSTEYTVKRMPAHYRYKKNGERNKNKEGEKFEIEAIPSRKIPGKKEDRDKYVREEILKVDASQFKKLIMLPQGAFSEFIRSNSKAKKETLEKIFDTAIYEKISDRLRVKVKELSVGIVKERDKAFAKLETLSIEDDRWKELLKERILSFDELDSLMKATQEGLTKANEELKAEIEKIDINTVIAELTKGENYNKGIEQLKTARELLSELEKGKEEVELKKVQLTRYNKARNIKGEYAAKERYTKDYLKKDIKYRENITAMEDYRTENDSKIQKLESIKESLAVLGEKVNTLEVLKSDVEKYKTLSKDTIDNRKEMDRLIVEDLVEKEKLEKQFFLKSKELEKQGEKIGAQLEKASELKIERERTENKGIALRELDRIYKKVQGDRKQLCEMEDKLVTLETEEGKILKEYREQNDLWFQAEAYKLSGRLEDGKPCLVCGSTEHPKKAEKPQGVPTERELEGLKKSYEGAGREKNKFTGELDNYRKNLNEKIKELEGRMAQEGISDNISLEEVLEENTRSLQEIDENLKGMPTRKDLLKAEEEKKQNTENLEEVKKSRHRVETSIASLKTKIKLGEDECLRLKLNLEDKGIEADTFEDGYKKAREEKFAKDKEVKDTEKLKEVKGKMESDLIKDSEILEELKEAMEKSVELFEKKLKDEEFANESEYLEAESIDGEKLEGKIKQYNNDRLRLVTIIDEKKEYEGRQAMDLGELEKRRVQGEEKIKELSNEAAKNISEFKGLEERKKELKITEGKIGREEKVLSVYKKLSDISEGRYGDKKNNITFQNYVLGVYFEEVLDRANERFAKMTGNQYEMLLHRKEKSGKGEAGLDINVFDSHTGRARSIKTLSGGETFKASMALALGLSDVVQGQSGGIRLDSVFIDEGFGTLDDESLSAAMDILMELKSSGRTVGIISHVNELKQTIASQIRVEKTTRGSTVEVVR